MLFRAPAAACATIDVDQDEPTDLARPRIFGFNQTEFVSMNITRRDVTIGGMSLLASASMSTTSRAELGEFLGIGEGLDDFALATDAYIFGYPLVTMEMTRRVVTNVAAPVGTRAPMGQIIKLRKYPDASFRDVTAPNADTLYTTAFFDVGSEPWVLSIPDMKDR